MKDSLAKHITILNCSNKLFPFPLPAKVSPLALVELGLSRFVALKLCCPLIRGRVDEREE